MSSLTFDYDSVQGDQIKYLVIDGTSKIETTVVMGPYETRVYNCTDWTEEGQ